MKNFEDFEIFLKEEVTSQNNTKLFYSFTRNNLVQCIFEFEKTIKSEPLYKERKNISYPEYILRAVLRRNIEENRGLAKKIAFDYFSKQFPNLISDERANNYGKPFFEEIFKQAKEKGFRVVGKLTRSEEEKYNPEDFEKYWIDQKRTSPDNPNISAGLKYMKIIFK